MAPNTTTGGRKTPPHPSAWTGDVAILCYLAAATVLVHLLTGNRYGFHRDELATLDDARHLAWGYVAYPPVTPFFARLSLALFGTSLVGFRLFAAVAQAATVVLAGLAARELGGGRTAQLIAAGAVLPACLAIGALMQYVSFDCLAWVLTCYFFVRLMRTRNPRWWLAVGAAIGFGMMAKYAMAFLVAGVVVAVLATDLRRSLKSPWLWAGVALSLLIFLPNLVWQLRHDFVSLDFLRHIHERDIRIGRTRDFLPDQLKFTALTAPLWLAGLAFSLFSPAAKRFRGIACLYLVPLVLFAIAKGRGYYLLGAYPVLYAAGGVWLERWMASLRRGPAIATRAVAWTAIAINVAFFSAVFLPIPPVNSRWWHFASSINGDLREEIGWPELVETVARIRDSLSPGEQKNFGILAGNYGEAGAINLYGPAHGLPQAISGANSFWARGYDGAPQTLIVLGFGPRSLDRLFTSCTLVAQSWNRYHVENEETRDVPSIYVCRGLKRPWPEFWPEFRYYG